MVLGSHATRGASIEVGNLGVYRRAWVAGVLIDLPGDYERRRSFYDSSRIAHAVDYGTALARELALAHNLDTAAAWMDANS